MVYSATSSFKIWIATIFYNDEAHTQEGCYGGSNTPFFPSPLLVREVGHVRGYPYPVYGKLKQLFFFFFF